MKFLILATLTLLTLDLRAEETKEASEGSCNKIMEACKSSPLFNNSGKSEKKKSLYKDCMQPLLSGQKIEGITVNEADVKDCNAKKAELKSKK